MTCATVLGGMSHGCTASYCVIPSPPLAPSALTERGAHTWSFAVRRPCAVLAIAPLACGCEVATAAETMRCTRCTISTITVQSTTSAA